MIRYQKVIVTAVSVQSRLVQRLPYPADLQIGFQRGSYGSYFFYIKNEQGPDNNLTDFGTFIRLAPQTMVDRKQIYDTHFLTPMYKSGSFQQPDNILPSSVTDIYVPTYFGVLHLHTRQGFTDGRDARQDFR